MAEPGDGLSLTAAATLATLDRSGPSRLTELAAREGVTQPAMTQLIARLAEQGLVSRDADPGDGRVVQVQLTAGGRATRPGAGGPGRAGGRLLRPAQPGRARRADRRAAAMDALAAAAATEPATAGDRDRHEAVRPEDDRQRLEHPPMSGTAASPFRQPKAVFAVAFACVVSFMGIGLVDPILPAISHELHASPSEVTLLFTSYLVVTAVAMLITNWVSSRIGAKKTLIAGLILIVVFSALAGASASISGIIGFRAGWGVGNALFIATSLAVIVASATGGFAGAIVLYETALGLGIAIGPLLGGVLGEISWRGPFYGVAA